MIGIALRPRDRRALQLGAVAVALLLVARVLPVVIESSRAAASRAQAASDRLEFSQRLIRSRASLDSSLSSATAALARADSALLAPGSPARVTAELAAQLTQGARDVGLAVLAASATGDTSSTTPLVRPRVRMETQGDVSGVMQFLLLLEVGRGTLDVREITVSQADPSAPNERPETLQLSIVVEGAARRHAPADAPGGSR